MQQQTLNYYRFWMVMVGAIGAIVSLHPFMGFIAGVALAFGGVVLPMFKGKIMSVTSKIENTVEQKVSQHTNDDNAVEAEQKNSETEDNKAA
jgi:Na+-translocating ferredoxin:NAD+ oxidoreductase RnfG subunit